MAGNIDIYIEFDGEKYQLPVLPAEVQIQSASGNESAATIALGEVTILKMRKLRSLTIESFFPAHPNYPFCRTRENFKKPSAYLRIIEKAQTELIPARLTITNTGLSTFWVSVEDFRYSRAQDDSISYSLSLKEYRPFGQRAKTMEQNASLFDETSESVLTESFGQVREPTDYAVGDRVVVSGIYYSSPDGALALLESSVDFMQQPYTSAVAALWKVRKDIGNVSVLNGQRCIIIDRDMSRITHYDAPIVGDVDVPVAAPYCYHIADLETRKAIGWVAEYQMRRLT